MFARLSKLLSLRQRQSCSAALNELTILPPVSCLDVTECTGAAACMAHAAGAR